MRVGLLKKSLCLEKIVCGSPAERTVGLETIILGSKELNVEPIRVPLERIDVAWGRIRWLLGILGVSSIAGLIGWILFILGKGQLP